MLGCDCKTENIGKLWIIRNLLTSTRPTTCFATLICPIHLWNGWFQLVIRVQQLLLQGPSCVRNPIVCFHLLSLSIISAFQLLWALWFPPFLPFMLPREISSNLEGKESLSVIWVSKLWIHMHLPKKWEYFCLILNAIGSHRLLKEYTQRCLLPGVVCTLHGWFSCLPLVRNRLRWNPADWLLHCISKR